ncbi:peroxiredoxin-like family protein [Carboxylicivirga sp. M1479]|uniref:peroxiredoxin-like family protein n=1 Tax=Carboxylicivirga sp. M1479 TaxID=2594476 RepID=UPI00163DB0E3|nr:peroxiredoxin-like family protein [Carboxylicivirga sp. M1479]
MKIFISVVAVLLISTSLIAQEGINVSEKAPLFKAKDQNGQLIDLAKELESHKVVLVFYRGQWCPHCNRHMSALQDSLSLINDKGAKVIAITPEKSEEIDKTVEKTGLNFSVVYDENHQIMDAYAVTFTMSKSKFAAYKIYGININKASGNEDRALPIPATYIISKDGLVIDRHFEKDYKRRMSVKNILKALK